MIPESPCLTVDSYIIRVFLVNYNWFITYRIPETWRLSLLCRVILLPVSIFSFGLSILYLIYCIIALLVNFILSWGIMQVILKVSVISFIWTYLIMLVINFISCILSSWHLLHLYIPSVIYEHIACIRRIPWTILTKVIPRISHTNFGDIIVC